MNYNEIHPAIANAMTFRKVSQKVKNLDQRWFNIGIGKFKLSSPAFSMSA